MERRGDVLHALADVDEQQQDGHAEQPEDREREHREPHRARRVADLDEQERRRPREHGAEELVEALHLGLAPARDERVHDVALRGVEPALAEAERGHDREEHARLARLVRGEHGEHGRRGERRERARDRRLEREPAALEARAEKPAPGTVKIRKMITATLNSAIAISSWSRQYAVASDTTAAVADCQNM